MRQRQSEAEKRVSLPESAEEVRQRREVTCLMRDV